MAAFAMATAQAQAVTPQFAQLSLDACAQAATPETARIAFARPWKGQFSSSAVQLRGFGAALAGSQLQANSARVRATARLTMSAAAYDNTIEDDWEEESEEDVQAAYEELYGKPFGGGIAISRLDADKDEKDSGDKPAGRARRGRGRGSGDADEDPESRAFEGRRGKDDLEERLIQVRRVTKVVKGGKQMAFRAVVVLGDKKGKVGVGVGKAKEVITAVEKAGVDARRHMVVVPMTKYLTFPHRADGRFGAAKIMLRPAALGTGVIAGGAVRVVLELAGIENALGKELRSGNPLNNARAVLDAVSNMRQFKDVSRLRGIPMEELWK